MIGFQKYSEGAWVYINPAAVEAVEDGSEVGRTAMIFTASRSFHVKGPQNDVVAAIIEYLARSNAKSAKPTPDPLGEALNSGDGTYMP